MKKRLLVYVLTIVMSISVFDSAILAAEADAAITTSDLSEDVEVNEEAVSSIEEAETVEETDSESVSPALSEAELTGEPEEATDLESVGESESDAEAASSSLTDADEGEEVDDTAGIDSVNETQNSDEAGISASLVEEQNTEADNAESGNTEADSTEVELTTAESEYDFSAATPLSLGIEQSIQSDGEPVIFSFTAEEEGYYKFRSFDSSYYDPRAELYNQDGEKVASNDDADDDDYNFCIVNYHLYEGDTVYLVATTFDYEEYSYKVIVEGSSEPEIVDPVDEPEYDFSTAIPLSLGIEQSLQSDGASVVLSFTAEEEGYYKFYSFDCIDCDPYAALYDQDGDMIIGDSDGGDDKNFCIDRFYLYEGETVYLVAEENIYEAFSYKVIVEQCESEPSGGNIGDITWAFENGTLSLTGQGAIPDYDDSWEAPWCSLAYEDTVSKIEIGEGITEVGDNAFADFYSDDLIEVVLADTIIRIGDYAFFSDSTKFTNIPANLVEVGADISFNVDQETVTLPDSLSVIGKYFRVSDNVTSLFIGKNVISIGEGFLGSRSECTVIVDEENPAYSSYEGSLYNKDRSVLLLAKGGESITIPESVTKIDEAALIYGFSSITINSKIKELPFLGGWDSFNLKEIQVSEDNPYYTSKDGVLYSKDQSQLLLYPSKKEGTAFKIGSHVTDIAYAAFSRTDQLKSVSVPDTVVSIDDGAFYRSSVQSIEVGKRLEKIGNRAFEWSEIKSIVFPATLKKVGASALNVSAAKWGGGESGDTAEFWFKGNAPEFDKLSFGGGFSQGKIKAYYPIGNATWTKNVLQNYGANTVNWYAWSPKGPVSLKKATISSIKARTYTGKAQKPVLKIVIDGYQLVKNVDFKCSYKNNTKVGTATVTITGINNYTGTRTVTFSIKKAANIISQATSVGKPFSTKAQTIQLAKTAKYESAKLTYKASNSKIKISKSGKVTIPAKFSGKFTITITSKATANYKAATKKVTVYIPTKPTLSSVTNSASKTILVKWKKTSVAKGYQVQYATNTSFKNAKSVTVAKQATVKTTIKKLTKGKKYYVRVRSYYTVGSKKYYSAWSKTNNVTIKK